MIRLVRLAVLFLLFIPTLQARPQGSKPTDRTAVQEFGEFQEGQVLDNLPSAVDLRPFLPQVGMQTMNDCAAWAFGYAGRSYLEAIDQGWQPDQPDRVFSPTFIYNQVNGGTDGGSRVTDVLDLLMNRGAATLSTAPYLAKDFLTPPPALALEEAKVFRIADFSVLADGPAIRRALAEGHIVLCCVRTNPVFSAGYSRPYTAEQHRQGQAARRPGQPHGFHAMAIVGYSDQREAFLFMNSWGQDWGENGFLWVSYEVLSSFNTAQQTTQLMDFALVMLDRHETLIKKEGSYQVVELDSLQPHIFAAYAGIDAVTGDGTWRYTLSLRGSADALGLVDSVTWQVPSLDGEQTFVSEDPASSFRLVGRSRSADIAIAGVAHLSSGKEVSLAAQISIPASQKRDLSLQRIDAFHRKWKSGQLDWRWTLIPQMSDTDWLELKSIRWHLDGEPEEQDKVYLHDGGLPPTWSLKSLAMPSYITSSPQKGSATLEFRDGSLQYREFGATAFTSEVLEHAKLEYVARQEGVDGGRSWHFLELRTRYPEYWKDEILGVRMGTGTEATWREAGAQQVGGPNPYMYVYAAYVDGPFWPSSTIFFRDQSLGFGRTTPARSTGTIDLGAASEWYDPWPEGENLDAPGRGYGLNYRDRFVGMVNGEPVWATEVFLDGNANHNIIEEITWEFGEGVVPDKKAQEQIYPWDSYRWKCLRTSKPFHAKAHCVDYQGFGFDLTVDVIPRSSANTGLAAVFTTIPVPELEAATPQQTLADVGLVGLENDLRGLRSMHAWPKRSWGGVLPVQLKWWRYNEVPKTSFARVEVRGEEPTLVVMEFDDGSVVALDSQPHALAPVATGPRLQILARERFLGWRQGQPTWQVDVDLRGDLSVLEKLQTVDWKVQEVGATEPIDLSVGANQSRFQVVVSQAARIEATLRFSAEAELPPQHLEALVTTFSPRFGKELTVRMERAWVMDLEGAIDSGDAGEFFDQERLFRFRIMGSPDQLQKVKQVNYSLQSQWGLDGARREQRSAPKPLVKRIPAAQGLDNFFSFEIDCGMEEEWLITPTVVFNDGTSQTFEVHSAGGGRSQQEYSPEESEPFVTVRDWGMVDSKRTSLIQVKVPPSSWTQDLMRLEPIFDQEAIPAGGSPVASFDRGNSMREFLIHTETAVKGMEVVRMDQRSTGIEMEDVVVQWPASQLAEMLVSPRVQVTSMQEGGAIHFVSMRVPASMEGEIQHVSYEVQQGGKRTVYLSLGRFGERSPSFEIKLFGEPPQSITARLFGESGLIRGGETRWVR